MAWLGFETGSVLSFIFAQGRRMFNGTDHRADEINFDNICTHFRDPCQFFQSRLIQTLFSEGQMSQSFP